MTPIKEEQIIPEILGRVFKTGNGWIVAVDAKASAHPLYLETHTTEAAAIDDLQRIIIRWRAIPEEVK